MLRGFKPMLRRLLPGVVYSHRIWAGPLRGARIVTSWHDYPAAIMGYTERPLLSWFAANVASGQTWLDIGAHYGYTAIALSRLVGAGGRVFAFEPMVSTAGHLARTRALNHLSQLTVVPFALGTADTMASERLPVIRGMIDSTLTKAAGVASQDGSWHEVVFIARLDWLWPTICGSVAKIDGIKIDVQGMEVSVLRGMLEILRVHGPKLVVELHRGVDRAELLDVVEAAGYRRLALPVEPVAGEVEPAYLDDRSYAFSPLLVPDGASTLALDSQGRRLLG